MTEAFQYREGELFCEEVPVGQIAGRHGTPAYVYSAASLRERYHAIRRAFAEWDPLVCFSVKCCGNVSVLKVLAGEGSGFDIVSGGELHRALLAGADPARIVFAGVGKTAEEISAALGREILMFNVESRAEMELISRTAAAMGTTARVAIRLNPDVDPDTHAKTTTGKGDTKFGIGSAETEALARAAADWPGIEVRGIHLHLGSPVRTADPYRRAVQKAVGIVGRLRSDGLPVDRINIGGGYCISYTGEEVIGPQDYAAAVRSGLEKSGCAVIIEPGRYIAGNSGLLVTRVIRRKRSEPGRRFVVCDAAMNDLIRPTLYDAFHRMWPVRSSGGMPPVVGPDQDGFEGFQTETVDVVGPVCETGDYLATDRPLPSVEAGDLLAVFSAGAYGFSMSSNYNARPRAAEVLVDGTEFRLIRRRETYDDLVAPERDYL